MAEQTVPGGHRAVVDDVGQWYDLGEYVHIERTRSGQSGYCLIPDVDGDRQVLGCHRTTFNGWPMLVVSLRRVRG